MSGLRVTAVFGGGGAKAAAHIGVHRALEEAGLVPTRYVGTSMGAVVAALLAGGLSAAAVLAQFRGVRRRDVARPRLLAALGGLWLPSLLRPAPFRRTLTGLIPAATFAGLARPLTATATDLDSGTLTLFGAGGADAPLADALYASCALPLLFPAGEIGGRRYADGGLRAVLPLSVAARFEADLVVAVHVGPGFDTPAAPGSGMPAMVRAHDQAMGIAMAANAEAELAAWRAAADRPRLLYLRPVAESAATFRVDQVDRYEAAGYQAARQALADLPPLTRAGRELS